MKRILTSFLFVVCSAMSQETAKFPDSVASTQDLLVSKDLSRSTLTAAIDDETLTIPVADGTKFAQFEVVVIGTEQIQICSIAGNQLTACARGFAGTTPASHISGLAVMGSPVAAHHNKLVSEIIALQTALGAQLSNILTRNPAGDVTFGGAIEAEALKANQRVLVGSVIDNETDQLQVEGSILANLFKGNVQGNVSGTAGSVLWANVAGRPTNVSSFINDANYISAGSNGNLGSINLDQLTLNAVPGYSPWTSSLYNTDVRIAATDPDRDSTVQFLNSANGSRKVNLNVSGTITGTQFIGSGAGLTASTVPIASLVSGDYSSKITSGTYPINITGSAPWASITGRPTALSQFSNDSGFLTATGTINQAINQVGYTSSGNWNTDFQNTLPFHRRWAEVNAGANSPSTGWWFVENMRHSNSSNYWGRQLAWGWESNANDVWTRTISNGSFGTWVQFALANGGTYWMNISGNATSATNVPWTGVTNKPSAVANLVNNRVRAVDLGCSSGYGSSCDGNGNGQIDYADSAGVASSANAVEWANVQNKPGNIVTTDGGGNVSIGGALTLNDTVGAEKWLYIESRPPGVQNISLPETNGHMIFHKKTGYTFAWRVGATGSHHTDTTFTEAMSLTDSGVLTIANNAYKPGGGSWATTSDVRTKENIRQFTDGLELVRHLKPKAFEYNGKYRTINGMTSIGVIAQDVEEIAPYMVSTMQEPENPGDPKTDVKTVDPSAMTWVLANAINDLERQTLKSLDVTEPLPACNADLRGQQRFILDDLEGDKAVLCGRTPDGNYVWQTNNQF